MFYLLEGRNVYSWIDSLDNQNTVIVNGRCSVCFTPNEIYTKKVSINVIGKRLMDYYDNFLFPVVSEQFKKVIEENSLTGIKYIELEVNAYLDSNRKPMDIGGKLYRILVTGRAGMWRNKNGNILEHCEECKTVQPKTFTGLSGFSTLEEEWDGSDFFMYSNQSALIIIDEKAYKILKKAKLKNIEMKQLEKCREF